MFGSGGSGGTLSVTRRTIDRVARQLTLAYSGGRRSAAAAVRKQGVTYGPCTSDTETALVAVSQTEEQIYMRTFYDSACTQLDQDIYLDVVATNSTTGTATGTDTQYTQSGTPFAYNTIAMSLTGIGTASAGISIEITDAATATSPQLGVVGVACGIATGASACGFGAVAHDQAANSDVGMTIADNVSVATGQGGLIDVTLTGSGAAYSGALNALSLTAGTFPAWAVSGGSAVDSTTVSGQLAFTPALQFASGTLTLTDSSDLGSASFTIATTGGNGSITDTATGKVVATFSVDATGTGTITYSNGTTGTISNWVLLG